MIALVIGLFRPHPSNFHAENGTTLENEAFQHRSSVWGPWATTLWAALIALLFIVAQLICMAVYLRITEGRFSSSDFSEALSHAQYDGLIQSLCTFATTVICGLLIVAAVKLKRGSDLRQYLGLTLPSKRQIIRWSLLLGAVLLSSDLITLALGKPIVPEYMARTYSSLESRWILWIAFVFAAPLFEELFFRGFLIQGLSASFAGYTGAIVMTSAVWAMIHLQYDDYGIASIFVMGLVLGAARVRTGSTVLTMLLHALANFVAMTETVIHLRSVPV